MMSKAINNHKPNFDMNLVIMGLSAVEKNLVSGICKLSRFRAGTSNGNAHRYSVVDANHMSDIDILLVDADINDLTTVRESIREHLSKAIIIWVSNNNLQTSGENEYFLARNRLGGALLRLLDEISDYRLLHNAIAKTPLKTCLVVDDSELMRTQMELILKEYGLGVTLAEDAEKAIQIIKENPFDLIFLDVILPEMDGYKACKQLKSDPKTKKTPVVMLTSKRSPFNKMHGALVGCDRYLTKPVDTDKVRQVLEQYSLIDKSAGVKI